MSIQKLDVVVGLCWIPLYMNMTCFLHMFGCMLLASAASSLKQGFVIRRFIHGCPFAFPCMLPPCENPVFGPGNCCGSCPDPEVTSANPDITSSADSGMVEEAGRQVRGSSRRQLNKVNIHSVILPPYTTVGPPKTTPPCPYPCTHNGHQYCEPMPCHITCVDAVKPPGACCYECPNGPNCSYNGHVIPESQNVTLPSGETVYCYSGDIYGGSYQVFG